MSEEELPREIGARMQTYRRQIRKLRDASNYLYKAIAKMKESNSFDQLSSGYGAETYEETILNIISGIKEKIVELDHDIPHIKRLMEEGRTK